ncbi:uncharacterized protein LOC128186878 isoform X2 [Crassostrea angulata]|uniref:uncharacterized protein LOC128186878 isoform X2 n=1 Tax=Magallana angulata TaxID=2784310 RepID=UPI0022B17CC0|nr:uncharacterized protein LOC128186878 isoform X2 [Crassostrea angulata]
MKTIVLLVIVLWNPSVIMQKPAGPIQCVIIQDKQGLTVPFNHPSFLTSNIKTKCQVRGTGQGMLRCGSSDVYIKPECVCSFYNVYEAIYHNHTSCPNGEKSDDVTKLKCPDCKMYSSNNNGPCINGGKLTCKGEEVAPRIICECPLNYKGMFCEEKIENVTRICDMTSISPTNDLPNCDSTKRVCVTYSKNRRYAYKCQETDTFQERRGLGLPLCIDTEDTTEKPFVNRTPIYLYTTLKSIVKSTKTVHLSSSAGVHVSITLFTFLSLILQI